MRSRSVRSAQFFFYKSVVLAKNDRKSQNREAEALGLSENIVP